MAVVGTMSAILAIKLNLTEQSEGRAEALFSDRRSSDISARMLKLLPLVRLAGHPGLSKLQGTIKIGMVTYLYV